MVEVAAVPEEKQRRMCPPLVVFFPTDLLHSWHSPEPPPTTPARRSASLTPSPSPARAGPSRSTTNSSKLSIWYCTLLGIMHFISSLMCISAICFDRDWKKIEAFVGSKTAIQIRSHAQKYFLKVQKNGTSEHVPPPRPKRKAAHPYPQKAPKNGQQLPQGTASLQVSCLLEPGYALAVDFSSTPGNSTSRAPMHSKGHSCLQPVTASQQTADDTRPAGVSTTNNCSTSTICLTTWPTSETAADREKLTMAPRVMPDFAQIYSFLGNVFEPGSTGHLEKLKEMDPIDSETVLLLMRNLAINLISPDYESHIRLLSSSNGGTADMKFAITNNIFSAC